MPFQNFQKKFNFNMCCLSKIINYIHVDVYQFTNIFWTEWLNLSHLNFTGHYMYTESSAPRRRGDKAWLLSPAYPSTIGSCLQFYYHMYGAQIGTLNVYLQVIISQSLQST